MAVKSKEDASILRTIKKYGITSVELTEILKKPRGKTGGFYDHSTLGRKKIGIISDTHIGSDKFDERFFATAGKIFREEEVEAVYHAGDILEGMSGRGGHVYELAHVGFAAQMKYAVNLWKKHFYDLKTYGIIGNHDLWYKIRNDSGISVGEELEHRLGKKHFEYLGENEADVKLGPKTVMKLFHPGDATAYAWSYKIQKLVNSFSSGRKPQIVIEGHYHKSLYMFIRNVHSIEAGTMCGQTGWMRSKKIECSMGFWILDITISPGGISRFSPVFYPNYE